MHIQPFFGMTQWRTTSLTKIYQTKRTKAPRFIADLTTPDDPPSFLITSQELKPRSQSTLSKSVFGCAIETYGSRSRQSPDMGSLVIESMLIEYGDAAWQDQPDTEAAWTDARFLLYSGVLTFFTRARSMYNDTTLQYPWALRQSLGRFWSVELKRQRLCFVYI